MKENKDLKKANVATFLCSLSFWVSANLTTIGEEHPSIVRLWCIALMATIAIWNITIEYYKREHLQNRISFSII